MTIYATVFLLLVPRPTRRLRTHAGSRTHTPAPYTHAGSGPYTHAGFVHTPAPVLTRRLGTLHARARLLIACAEAGGFSRRLVRAAAFATRAATPAFSASDI